ncbi:GTP-binding protein [Hymenobacter arizonensis]|uniref:GTPase, G3E family n=1 Tax=Hymenobacter arizonensis TaxID=1227077 RepID=A0A1I6AT23_HYMAR|nr:GTP-binding protein [Hymenobacter arizonensis]SFQ71835.1 GTPase, G3E family [Hymenobacter arizonensis]
MSLHSSEHSATQTASLAAPDRLPVTVLGGFTGAGKTSVLNHLLRQRAELQLAVISSDSEPVAAAVAVASLSHTTEKVIRLATEAGTHELRADLLLEAGRLARDPQFGYLLVENPGLAALRPVRHTFCLGNPAYGLDLPRRTRLDTLATVVDAGRFLSDFLAPADLPAHPDDADQALGTRAEVLAEQVEQAHVLILNKTDQATPAELAQLRTLLHHLNPAARLVEARFGEVDPAELLHTGLGAMATGELFDLDPPTPAHGISTCHFRDERPFHPERLWELVRHGWPAGLLRSQGLFWLASRPEEVMGWNQAGPSRRVEPVGTWWAAVPDCDQDPGFRRDELGLLARWHPQFQDRVNTLRFVGQNLDEARLRADLQACLCTPLEIGRWRRGALFADPWPRH